MSETKQDISMTSHGQQRGTSQEAVILERSRQLRESENRFRSLTAVVQDAIIMIDDCGNVSFWNPAATKIFGYAPEEVMGRNVHELLAAAPYLAQYREAFPRFQQTGQGHAVGKTLRLRGVRKDGKEVPIELSLSPVDMQGKWHAVAIVKDISERLKKEAALRESEHRYRQLLQAVTTYAYSVKLENGEPVSTTHGKGCLGDTGYTPEEYGSDPKLWVSMIYPDDRAMVLKHIAAVLAGNDVPPVEHRIVDKDGTVRWVRDTIVRYHNEAGVFDRYDGLLEDITEHKRAEESLRESEKRYRQLLAAVTSYTYSVELENGAPVSTTHSLGCLAATGYTPEEYASDPNLWFSMIHSDDRAMISKHVAAVLAGEDVLPVEHRIVHKVGTVCWVRDTIVRHHNEAGVFDRYDGVVEDITQRKLAEEALREKDAELRQAQKLEAVGQLAGGIAHEFNNVLQAIGGYGNCAMEGLSPQEQRYQDLQQVLKAADRAAMLTRQLLGFSRRQVLRPRNVDPNQVVGDLAKMLQPIIGEQISLEVVLGDDVGTVYADPAELQEVLLNLCLNARDAMPSGGTLALRTDTTILSEPLWEACFQIEPGPHVVFSVTDTGCGMRADVQQRVFEPFFTTKEVGKGTGLGLAMLYGVVQQHKGAIHVYSEPGKGTTFKLYLPTGRKNTEHEQTEESKPAPGGSETILVAEDDPMVRNVAVRILEKGGYTVLAASDGQEALRIFGENRSAISLILLDVIMPKLGGHEVYRRIKAQYPEVKVIFASGYDPETNHSKLIFQENLRLIEKPFDASTLLCTVREVLDEDAKCRLAAQATS